MWKTITETRPYNVIFILLVVPTALSSLLPSCCWASSSSASASSSPYVRFEPSRPRRSVHQRSMHRLPRSFGVAAFSSSSSSSSLSSLSSALSASSSLLAPSPSLPLLPPPSRRAFRSTAAAMTKLSHSSNRLRQDLRQAAEAEERESTAAGGIDDAHDAGEEDDPLKWEKLYYGGSNDNNNNNNNDNNNNNNNNGNKKSTMTSSASATSSSPIRVITFDLDNTLWKTTPTISHANDVLAEYLQTTLGFDKDTRVEHEMGRLFRQFPERYVGLSSPSSASSGEKPKEMEKEYERRSDKVVEEEESLARLVENVGQTPLSLSLNDRDDKVTNDHDTAENDNNGNGDGDGVHISSVRRNHHNNAIQPSGAIKPVYLTLLRKDAIRSLILQKRPSLSPSSSSSSDLSPTEIETIVDQAFRIWIDARIHSIQSNFAIHAVECLGRLRRDIPSIPTPSAPRQRLLPNLYVGAITDGNSDPASVPPLRDMFDFVIRAEDVGTSKPDRRVYRAAVGELMIRLTRDGWGAETFFLGMDDDDDHDGTKMTTGIVDDAAKSWKDLDDDTLDAFSEAVGPWWVHVGDDFFKDVVAAKEFGMRSVWVRELIGGAGDTRGSGRGGGDDTDQANDDNTKKERTVQDLVEEISKKNGVVEMAIGESNFLMNALHEEFSDAILEKFEDLADLLIGWHTEGCIGGVGEVVDENMEKKEKNAPVDEPLPPPNVPPSVEGETQKKVDVKFCVFCGEKLPAVAKFCSGCGERQP